MKKKISSILFPLTALLLLSGNSMTVGFCECLGSYFIAAVDCTVEVESKKNADTCCCQTAPVEDGGDPDRDCDDQITLKLEEFVSPDGRLFADTDSGKDLTLPRINPATSIRPFSAIRHQFVAPRGSPPPPGLSLSKLCIRQV